MCIRNFYKPSLAAMMLLGVAGCSSLGGAGPSTNAVRDVAGASYADAGIAVIELNSGVIAQLNQYSASNSFAELFDDEGASETLVGRGDTLDIAIWEAPPAVLFGTTMEGRGFAGGLDVASSASIPSQQVGDDGKITVPFIGRIEVLGLRPDEVERIITSRLSGRANNPQAVVRLIQNESRTATILGMMPLDCKVGLGAMDLLSGKKLQGAIMGMNHFPVDLPRLVDFYMRGLLDLDTIIAERIPLDKINDGFDKMREGHSARSVVVFD